jgi:hypothetical protein
VDTQYEPRILVYRGGVVGYARAVRGADLTQPRAAFFHNVWYAEAAAYLYQLAARDYDFPAFGQRVEHDQHCRGVVVDDGRSFAPGESGDQLLAVQLALPAPAARQVVFQVRVV